MNVGEWLLALAVASGLLTLYGLGRSFYLACIKGTERRTPTSTCKIVDASAVPVIAHRVLEKVDAQIAQLDADHLGFIQTDLHLADIWSSVWYLKSGDGAACAVAFTPRLDSARPRVSGVHCLLTTKFTDGTSLQTANTLELPSGERAGNVLHTFPVSLDPGKLLQVHRARVSGRGLHTAPKIETLESILENTEEHVDSISAEMNRRYGVREAPSGRVRISARSWTMGVVQMVPPVSTWIRLSRRARARRELKELGLLHLWKRP